MPWSIDSITRRVLGFPVGDCRAGCVLPISAQCVAAFFLRSSDRALLAAYACLRATHNLTVRALTHGIRRL